MFNNCIYFVVLALFLFFSTVLINHERKATVNFIGISIFSIKFLLILFNEEFYLLPPKHAGDYALVLYKLFKTTKVDFSGQELVYITFLVQTIINYIPFEIFGANRINLLLTNSFLISFSAYLAYYELTKRHNEKTGFIAFIIITLLPVGINFSIFGLRDPLIFFFMTINILGFLSFKEKPNFFNLLVISISTLAVFSLRPEMLSFLIIPFVLSMLFLFMGFLKKIKEAFTLMILSIIISLSLIITVTYLGPKLYLSLLKNIGVEELISPAEIASTFADNRYQRFEDDIDGGGSQILSPKLYYSINWLPRWILQSIGIVILPFPWALTSITKLLAFLDSIVFLLMIRYWKRNYNVQMSESQRQTIYILGLTFIFSVLIMGLLINNAGNAFRMRMSIAPYLIILTTIIYGEKSKKQQN